VFQEEVTTEKAMNTKAVTDEITKRVNNLLELADHFLNKVLQKVERFPYGLRVICRELFNVAK
jgi:hypothetical protein